jgi:hypothetical protein
MFCSIKQGARIQQQRSGFGLLERMVFLSPAPAFEKGKKVHKKLDKKKRMQAAGRRTSR